MTLLHVQNRTKTVYAKAKAPERRAKFDPAEAMCQLNRIGHDFSRVQVGKGRLTCKCLLCFLRGERSFLKQLLGKPCSACHFAQRCSFAYSRPIPTPDDTPSSEDDPFGWSGDFDQEHQAMSDQELPFSPDERMDSAEMDFRSSVDPSCCHAMEEADPQCASSMPDALCTAGERASVSENKQRWVPRLCWVSRRGRHKQS